MSVHTSVDGEWPAATDALDSLYVGETFRDNEQFADFSARDVVDRIFPAAHGWQITAAEPGFFYVLFVLHHPDLGVAVAALGTVEPGGGVGTEDTWEDLDAAMRARNTAFIHLAQGPNALAILTHYKAYHHAKGGNRLPSGVESFLHRLFGSPEFMDDEAATMVALGAFTDLVKVAHAKNRDDQDAAVAAHLAASAT